MNIAVFCASSQPANPAFAAEAAELGRLLARDGHTLVYGGSNLGLMGAVSGAALAGGGCVVGVIPTFFSEAIITSQPVSRLVRVKDMAERKAYIMATSDAYAVLPGGVGTLDELSEVLVANQLLHAGKPVALLNTGGFYDPLLAFFRQMEDCGVMRRGTLDLLHVAATAGELLAALAG